MHYHKTVKPESQTASGFLMSAILLTPPALRSIQRWRMDEPTNTCSEAGRTPQTRDGTSHDDRLEIDASLVARLIAGQFPQWAALPLTPVTPSGWDNRTFRLGDTLSVRLPSAERYAAQVAKEQRRLPTLAATLLRRPRLDASSTR
jgi:hypothetical protein